MAIQTASSSLPNLIAHAVRHEQVPWAQQLLTRAWQFRHDAVVLCAEGVLATFAFAFSAGILSVANGHSWAAQVVPLTLPWLVSLRLFAFLFLGSYKLSLWEPNFPELIRITEAVSFSSLAFYAMTRFALDASLPAVLLMLDWTLLILLLAGLHLGLRAFMTHHAIKRNRGRRALIVGAGDAGTSVVRELVLDPASAVLPVGLVDDDPQKHGTKVCGVPVLGSIQDLARFVRKQRAEEVLICVPSATRSQMRSILTQCRRCGIPVRTLPSLAELVNGQASQRDFRALPVEALLDREEVTPDPATVQQVVGDRVVLVTGAGGSIGSELCRQIAAARPRKLLLLDKSENSLFYVNLELHERFPMVSVEPLLVDMTCRDRVRQVFERERPEVVFHAAAHKHVHLLELHPHEAVRNNVLGTRNAAFAAREFGTARFVNISTDKAVSPRNYMGLSKKVTELLIRELAQSSRTRFMNVRFGNVAGSTGSVLRLFRDQIQKGGPLRITDPRATRYFMTIAEAVCLILHAAAQGRGGETFVFDMGEPLNIYEMARALSLFSGLAPGKDLPIEFVGLKEGEKITEELWERCETPEPTAHDRIFVLSGAETRAAKILKQIEELERLLASADYDGVLACLHRAFPEFAVQHGPQLRFINEEARRPHFQLGGQPHERATVPS